MPDADDILNATGGTCIMKSPSVCPASSPHHLLSVSSPSAPAAESNCPTTSDSRSCTGSLSSPSRNPQSSARRPLPLPEFAFTRLYASQTSHLEIQNGFASLIGSSHCWLAH